MKIAFLSEEGFSLLDEKVPTCKDDEILIKVTACGICSGDVFVYQNRDTMAKDYPRLGHEASGVIAAVGNDVQSFAVGDSVTTFGVPAYAEYLVTTPDTTVKLPSEVDLVYALGEAVACCVHAGNRFGTQPGDRVAIIGSGFMGVVCQQIAKYQGAEYILAIDPLEDRRNLAIALGASEDVDPTEMDDAAILERYGEFDVVIEAVGNQQAVDLSTLLVKQHGKIIFVGYHQTNQGERTVNMQQWNFKAIDVINGHVRRMDEKLVAMQEGMELMKDGHIIAAPLVTVYPFDDISIAFQDLSTPPAGLLKAVLQMELA